MGADREQHRRLRFDRRVPASIYRVGANPPTFSHGEELLLGLGHTVGIAVQLLVLLPYLKASGHHYAPKFGLRGTGLGHTARLGLWTVLFVAVNQVTLVVVTQAGHRR